MYPNTSTTEDRPSSKVCSRCKESKPHSEFNKHKGTPDGLSRYCKSCRSLIRQEKPWYDSPKAKAYMREYSSSPEKREERKRYAQSERGKETSKERFRRYYQKNKHKAAARYAVGKAVKSGLMPHPSTLVCACGNPASEYHHDSYDEDRWLDVVAMCDSCHDALHYNVYEKENGGE